MERKTLPTTSGGCGGIRTGSRAVEDGDELHIRWNCSVKAMACHLDRAVEYVQDSSFSFVQFFVAEEAANT